MFTKSALLANSEKTKEIIKQMSDEDEDYGSSVVRGALLGGLGGVAVPALLGSRSRLIPAFAGAGLGSMYAHNKYLQDRGIDLNYLTGGSNLTPEAAAKYIPKEANTMSEEQPGQSNTLRNSLIGAASIAGLGVGGMLLRKRMLSGRHAGIRTPKPNASAAGSYAGGSPVGDPAAAANAAAAAGRRPGPVPEAAETVVDGFNTPFADLQAKMQAAKGGNTSGLSMQERMRATRAGTVKGNNVGLSMQERMRATRA